MIDAATYAIERAICDKAQATLEAGWPGHAKGGAVPQAVCDHPDYKACDNAMRGRVEQYELLTATPERFGACVSSDGKSVTVWTGDVLGRCHLGSGWRVSSFIGSRMYQATAWINGREFTGRTFGSGMFIGLRETAASKRKRGA